MQYVCLFLELRKNCDFIKGLLFAFLVLSCCQSARSQETKQQLKVLQQGTTVDSIRVQAVKVGGLFLEVKSYFEEYSPIKPACVTQLYLQEINKKGELVVRYVYTHALLEFHVETTLTYPNASKQVFGLDQSRRAPLLIEVGLLYQKQLLQVDLL
ncbi:Uncharacterised protein [Myroides odoratus]|uniref:Uncharacterized protein n=1 Tax=Myroides odoratus TaxID=256 RepID=A0A9Q6Z616_MYROD|nr:hypothetical protein Myrod_2176 [Myroides odoratus DSM 2801]EKB07313.1 hypothetical protein HMPREF9716_02036 [Myroides odoratus CIP 103059]QQU00352.1 hypothetical protein I6I88_00825 [Myroides odoratus]STZ30271.1 Uncharacterised protein [Myroides odoratus]